MPRNPDRLTALDSAFLHIEDSGAHMHVGSVLVFDGDAPPYEELVAQIAEVPLQLEKACVHPRRLEAELGIDSEVGEALEVVTGLVPERARR